MNALNERPIIPRLAPNVVSLDEARAWHEFQMAVKVIEDLAKEEDKKPAEDEKE